MRDGNGREGLDRKGVRLSGRVAAALVALVVAVALMPAAALAWSTSLAPAYEWYGDGSAGEFTLSSPRDWRGFVELVNGTAEGGGASGPVTFSGKTVKLASDLNFQGQTVTPAGGMATDASFDGTFDGQGHVIDNFALDVSLLVAGGKAAGERICDIGLIGHAGAGSAIRDVTVGSGGSVVIELNVGDIVPISNIGLLAGALEGSLTNARNNGSITISDTLNQTKAVVFPVSNVGGLAGIVLGDVAGCTNAGSLSISETGVPYKVRTEVVGGKEQVIAEDKDWDDLSTLVVNVGGVVGSAGSVDSTVALAGADAPEGYRVDNRHGSIKNCANTGKIFVDTPAENGLDRFGNVVYVQSGNIGGTAGYSRGSVSSCANSGYLDVKNGSHVGGVVGSLRSPTETTNFSAEGTDDGLRLHLEGRDDMLVATDCTNAGLLRGRAFVGGIVGCSGAYTAIDSCLNDVDAYVVATRTTKPFPAGIVGSSYGNVAYCANLGTVASGDWADPNNIVSRQVKTSGGYYAAGIAGLLAFHQVRDDENNVVRADMSWPELYGCYNAGAVMAIDGMRQRALVGDNSGYVHDNVAEAGKVYQDRLVYGMYEGETGESTGGQIERNVTVTNSQLKNNEPLTSAQLEEFLDGNDASSTVWPLALMNKSGASSGWSWAKSDGVANAGYPVLASKVSWNTADIAQATVKLAADAEYSGLPAAPSLDVALADGTVLIQDVDFVAVADENAVELSQNRPYKAIARGIGNYSGDAASTAAYDVVRGQMSNCSVLIDNQMFNWEPHELVASGVHVTNASGQLVDPSEYAFAFDPSDANLTDGKAVNAKTYNVIVSAAPASKHFAGSTTTTLRIKTGRIMYSNDPAIRAEDAYPVSVSYDGVIVSGDDDGDGVVEWDSMTAAYTAGRDKPLTAYQYTGHPIRPTVTGVTYLGRPLVEGRDYFVAYSNDLIDTGSGWVDDVNANVGEPGKVTTGYVTVHYVAGSNFSNYDNMWFSIDGTRSAKLDLSKATATFADGAAMGPIPFEEGTTYEPVELWYGGSQLTEGVDYTIDYARNDEAGTASFTATAAANSLYEGALTGTFELVEAPAYTLTWDFSSDGTAWVTGVEYTGANEAFDLEIPAEISHDGATYRVTAIADKAFGGSTAQSGSDFTGSLANVSKLKVRSVRIPASVRSIGAYAFSGGSDSTLNNNLQAVMFDDAEDSLLETIGEGAFRSCGNLSTFTFPPKVASIGAQAFRSAKGATKLHRLVFLTHDPALPSQVATRFAFTGVGWDGEEVAVYGHEGAAKVVQLAADNATSETSGTGGVNQGKNFKFYSMGENPPASSYAVSFDAAGGSPVPDTQTVSEGQRATQPASPVREGFVFGGWQLDGKAYSFSAPVTADIRLTASWVAQSGPSSPDSVTMLRLYNPNSGEHFYTASEAERDMLTGVGWQFEGSGWIAPLGEGIPVFRLYNPNNGDHHYTPSEAERDMLVGVGWIYEQIGWNSAQTGPDAPFAGGVPLLRLYNPNNTAAGSHHYTASEAERDMLVGVGWRFEGAGWYGLAG